MIDEAKAYRKTEFKVDIDDNYTEEEIRASMKSFEKDNDDVTF